MIVLVRVLNALCATISFDVCLRKILERKGKGRWSRERESSAQSFSSPRRCQAITDTCSNARLLFKIPTFSRTGTSFPFHRDRRDAFLSLETFHVLREICLCTSSRNDPTQMIAAFDERNVPSSFFIREFRPRRGDTSTRRGLYTWHGVALISPVIEFAIMPTVKSIVIFFLACHIRYHQFFTPLIFIPS